MEPEQSLTQEHKAALVTFIQFLKAHDICLLCLDFDLTLCSVHSFGEGVPSGKVRPLFIYLHELAKTEKIEVCVTTLHGMVEDVRKDVSAAFDLSAEEMLIVRSPANTAAQEEGEHVLKGKLPLIQHAWRDVFSTEPVLKQCMLVDDDKDLVRRAKTFGCPGFWFNPNLSLEAMLHSLETISARRVLPKKKDKSKNKVLSTLASQLRQEASNI